MAGLLYKSFPVTGVEPDGDDLKVVGRCSDGQVDLDGDIVSPQFMASAIKEWLASYPAVRYQHRGDHPAGRGLEAWQDADGSTWLKALICDDAAKRMVRKRVLRSFSVGLGDVQTRKSSRCPRYEIVGGRLVEVSVCDSPSNPRCGIEVIGKSAGGQAVYVGKAFGMAKKPVKYKIDKSGQVVTKSGRVVLSKSELAAIGQRAARETALAGYLNFSDPWIREQARKAAESSGLYL